MTVVEAVILGTVQGITEFLPISSSAHLVIFQNLIGLPHSDLTFDIIVHLGTLVAILVFFGRQLFKVSFKTWILVGIGTIPAVIIGLLFKDALEAAFSSLKQVSIELIITGFINWFIDRKLGKDDDDTEETGDKDLGNLTVKQVSLVGIAQAIAIAPGISRSGSTLLGGLSVGLNRYQAFELAFLLAIPAILGAGVLQLKDVWGQPVSSGDMNAYIAGFFVSMVVGLATLGAFRWVIKHARFEFFAWYAWIVGFACLIWAW